MNRASDQASWNRLVEEVVHDDSKAIAQQEFFGPDVDRVGLVKRALRLPGENNRVAALAVIKRMTVEEQKQLFTELIELARAVHGPVGVVRELILGLPREWVLHHIDGEVDRILREGDYDDYWMFLALFDQLDPGRAWMLAERAASNKDPDTRELGLQRITGKPNSARSEAGNH